MRTFLSAVAACAALLFGSASVAHAEAEAIQDKKDGRFPMTLRIDSEFMSGTVDRITITKMDAGAGLALDAIPRLTLYADILVGAMRLGIDSSLDDGLKGNAVIWEYVDLAARTGASVRMLDRPHWKLDLFAEYESSLVGLGPQVTSLSVDTAEGRFDVSPFAGKNAEPELFWNRFSAGLNFRAALGRFTPGITVAYQLLDAELDMRLTKDGRDTLKRLGYDDAHVEHRHTLAFWSVPITPELEYELTERTDIGIRAVIMPAGDSMFFGGGIFCRYRL